MPTDHIKQWLHNRGFISRIDPDFSDWAVTATFYTALHAVDALLKHDGVRGIVNHASRNNALMRITRYAKIWKHYQPLHDLSRTIRYMANPQRWVAWPDIEGEVFRRFLYPLEKSVRKLMKEDGDLPTITMKSAIGSG